MRALDSKLDLQEVIEFEVAEFVMVQGRAVRALGGSGERVVQGTGHAVRRARNLVGCEPVGRDAVNDVVV